MFGTLVSFTTVFIVLRCRAAVVCADKVPTMLSAHVAFASVLVLLRCRAAVVCTDRKATVLCAHITFASTEEHLWCRAAVVCAYRVSAVLDTHTSFTTVLGLLWRRAAVMCAESETKIKWLVVGLSIVFVVSAVAIIIALLKAEKGADGRPGKDLTSSVPAVPGTPGAPGAPGVQPEISLMVPLPFVKDEVNVGDISPDMFAITTDGRYLSIRGSLTIKAVLAFNKEHLLGTLATPLKNSAGTEGVVHYQLFRDAIAINVRIVDKVYLSKFIASTVGLTLPYIEVRYSCSVIAPVI